MSNQQKLFASDIPRNVDGLEALAEEVVEGERLMELVRRAAQEQRIKNEYRRRLKERPRESEDIRYELAEEHLKSERTIRRILYEV